MQTIRYSLFVLIAVIVAIGNAHAQDIDSGAGYNITVGGGFVSPDNDRHLGGDAIGTVGVGYRFGRHWGAELTFGRSALGGNNRHSDADLDHYRLDAVYNFLNGRWQPYVSGGVARSNYSYDRASSVDDTQVSFGGGVKYFLSPSLFLRGDLRALHGEGSRTDGMYTVSVGYLFGQSSAASTQPVAAAASDRDGDGVVDQEDRCPNTPAGAPVDVHGCALDSDGDGVPDYRDECPDTKRGARVDDHGCYVILEKKVSFRLNVRFPFNSAKIPARYDSEVARLARFLKQYPQTDATVEGHTDNVGPAAYNQKLSQERAGAVVDMLVDKYGISRARLTPIGYGESRPVADNSTEKGRDKNRRVVAVIKATVKERQ